MLVFELELEFGDGLSKKNNFYISEVYYLVSKGWSLVESVALIVLNFMIFVVVNITGLLGISPSLLTRLLNTSKV